MATLARGHRALRPPLRLQPYNPKTQLHPHPSVCYLLFSTTARKAAKAAKPKPTSSQSSTPTTPAQTITTPSASETNAPTSTLPAEIDTPAPLTPSASTPDKLKRLVSIGRAYLSFYKTGLKNVFRNYKASLPFRAQLGLPAYLPTSPPRGTTPSNGDKDSGAAGLGRGQFQLVRRSARDVRRMIPFAMVLLVCGEFTPLIIPIFGSAITPATCRVPSQIAKERDTASKRKTLALRAVGAAGEEVHTVASYASRDFLKDASAENVLTASALFGLIKRHDKFAGSLLVRMLYRKRLERYIQYLAIDDQLIRAGGGVKKLSLPEVKIALDERGLSDCAALLSGGKAEVVQRETLERWLDVRSLKP
ncbi:hypothetical protein N7532_001311 [Penicillium argentinense]|uniref:Letm1 RBD domain-containing protein n=1 Tax=Penicillium argentinense TaxID=1131581 RepID=A0A9W9KMB1_9EURO|nr:uncharacterized protein N7532_001311 [Penicillium argentinense]KAJ5110776.1 hypothetical protein N7532_001311 [Penicillium argentinense]